MVVFNDKQREVQITLSCDRYEYLDTIKALADAISDSPTDVEYRYLLCSLIKDMLPDFDQLINRDEAAQLENLKTQNKQTVDNLINAHV